MFHQNQKNKCPRHPRRSPSPALETPVQSKGGSWPPTRAWFVRGQSNSDFPKVRTIRLVMYVVKRLEETHSRVFSKMLRLNIVEAAFLCQAQDCDLLAMISVDHSLMRDTHWSRHILNLRRYFDIRTHFHRVEEDIRAYRMSVHEEYHLGELLRKLNKVDEAVKELQGFNTNILETRVMFNRLLTEYDFGDILRQIHQKSRI